MLALQPLPTLAGMAIALNGSATCPLQSLALGMAQTGTHKLCHTQTPTPCAGMPDDRTEKDSFIQQLSDSRGASLSHDLLFPWRLRLPNKQDSVQTGQ